MRPPLNALEHIRIVLVEPQHPGNVGGCARALKNMGLTQLWLVNPARFPNPQAEWRAANALDVLEGARVVDSLDAAIADCRLVIGTSTRSRRIPWPVLGPAETADLLLHKYSNEPTAVLFGRESSGLSNDELQRCNKHLQIPANPEYASLNLAMSVQVVCYELYRQLELDDQGGLPLAEYAHGSGAEYAHGSGAEYAHGSGAEYAHWDRRWATAGELEGFIAHLDKVLQRIDFYDESNKRQTLTRLRRLYTRLALDETEVQMLRGILSQIELAAGD